MKKIVKQIVLFYFIIVLVKVILSSLIPTPSAFSDEYIYMRMARNFFFDFNFNVHNLVVDIYNPLYPILLSISYVFKDMGFAYLFMKVINSLISSLVIIPAFLLSKEFLDEKKSLIISLLVSIMPSNFSFAPYILSENLFYPLSLFTIYFIYKSFLEKEYYYSILVGVSLGLAYLTKTAAIGLLGVFVLSYVILFVIKEINRKVILTKFLLSILFFLVIISPWVIRNFYLYGLDLRLLFGPYARSVENIVIDFKLVNYIIRGLVYIGYLILASLIIFPIKFFNLFNRENMKFLVLFFSFLIVSLVIVVKHGRVVVFFEWFTGRYVGRYIDILLPLILIGGFIGSQVKKINKTAVFISGFLLIVASLLTLHSLFPVNNMSLTWVGVLKYIFEFIFFGKISHSIEFFKSSLIFFVLFFLFLLLFLLYLEKKFSFNKLVPYFFIFFILLNLLNYGIIYYDSKSNWYDQEQMQLGLWLNKYDSDKVSNILFDIDNCGDISKYEQDRICGGKYYEKTIIGYWLNDNIVIGDVSNAVDYDYVISKKKLNLPLIKESKNIYIY